MNTKFQIYSMFAILGAIIFFSIVYPLMKFTDDTEAMKLSNMQRELSSLKNKQMDEDMKAVEVTRLQGAMSIQKVQVEKEKQKPAQGSDLIQTIVISSLVLSLIWILFHEVKIIAYFMTLILFSITVYVYLRDMLGIDLLDPQTQLKIAFLVLGSFVSGILCVFLFVFFNKALHRKNMDEVLESVPEYVHSCARSKLYTQEATGKWQAYATYALIPKSGHEKFITYQNDNFMKEDEKIHDRYNAQTAKPANNMPPIHESNQDVKVGA